MFSILHFGADIQTHAVCMDHEPDAGYGEVDVDRQTDAVSMDNQPDTVSVVT